MNPLSGNWILEAIPYSYTLCRIKINGEYLFATDKTATGEDLTVRKIVTLKNVAINETDHSTWEITKFKYGYLIKNVAYSEFLFAGEDMRARDQKHRQVFTSKNVKRAGDLRIWAFDNYISGKTQIYGLGANQVFIFHLNSDFCSLLSK